MTTFNGTVEMVMNYFNFVATETREWLSKARRSSRWKTSSVAPICWRLCQEILTSNRGWIWRLFFTRTIVLKASQSFAR